MSKIHITGKSVCKQMPVAQLSPAPTPTHQHPHPLSHTQQKSVSYYGIQRWANSFQPCLKPSTLLVIHMFAAAMANWLCQPWFCICISHANLWRGIWGIWRWKYSQCMRYDSTGIEQNVKHMGSFWVLSINILINKDVYKRCYDMSAFHTIFFTDFKKLYY